MRALVRAIAPGAVVLLATLGVLAWLPEEAGPIVEDYALVAFGVGLALAWVFHRSRAFIALGLLVWLDLSVIGPPMRQDLLMCLGTVVVGLVGILGLLRDRGVWSRIGLLQVLVASVAAYGAGAVFADSARVAAFVSGPRIPGAASLVWQGYPAATLLMASAALGAVCYGAFRYPGPIERALIWVLLFMVAAMHPVVAGDRAALLLMAAGVTLAFGMVETSYVLAYQDELTGLPGRRALMQYLDEMQGQYAVAMVDIDHFKRFNDRHGHDVGDQVLRLVAGRLEDAPGGARAYRYGGEEFTLLFPGRTMEDAFPHAEAVRASIEQARFRLRSWKRPRSKPEGEVKPPDRKPKQLSVTVSIGVSDSTQAEGVAEVLKAADEALYRAKKRGRNRVAV